MELRKWPREVNVDYIVFILNVSKYSSFDEVGHATSYINLLIDSKSITLEQVLGYSSFFKKHSSKVDIESDKVMKHKLFNSTHSDLLLEFFRLLMCYPRMNRLA